MWIRRRIEDAIVFGMAMLARLVVGTNYNDDVWSDAA